MKRLQIMSFLAVTVLTLSSVGCTGNQTTEQSTAESVESEMDAANASDVETGTTYTGTVSAITEESISITTEDEEEMTIPLSSDTAFTRGGMGGRMGQDVQNVPEGMNGEAPDGEGGTPSERPEGEGEAPESGMPQGMRQKTLTYEDISVGDEVTVEVGNDGTAKTVTALGGAMGSGMAGGAPGGASGVDSYDAVNEYTEDTEVTGDDLTSNGTDENAVLVSTEGITVTMDGVTVTRESADSTGGDNSSFYGVGAASLVTEGTLSISDSTITTDAAGGAGVFAYGDGVAYVSDTVIYTEQDTSGGIHAAGGGTLYAWNLTVETNGESAAAIRSDRGSGTMVVDGGTYTSNGEGSPAVYSTADITINDATLTASGSEAICIEGLNTIRLFDCDLTGNMSDLDQNDCTWNVILYQSMSGDSEVGNSTFEMVGGTLTAENGDMFYTTNTESTFILSGVDITNAAGSEFLLKCTGNSNQRGWGTSGDNGADCHFTALDQELEGDVIWDTISQLDFYLTQGSTLIGAVVNDETNAGDGGSGYAKVYVDADSTWIVTADSTLTELASAGMIVDEDGNTVSIVGTDGTEYVSGTSGYSITVESYTDSVDTTEAASAESWTDFAVEMK